MTAYNECEWTIGDAFPQIPYIYQSKDGKMTRSYQLNPFLSVQTLEPDGTQRKMRRINVLPSWRRDPWWTVTAEALMPLMPLELLQQVLMAAVFNICCELFHVAALYLSIVDSTTVAMRGCGAF